jgi:hypothetical protein
MSPESTTIMPNKSFIKDAKELLNSKLPASPLAWPPHFPRTPEQGRLTPQDHNNSFILARDYMLNTLKNLKAENILVTSNVPLKQDGEPFLTYADAILEDPGVAVYFYIDNRPYAIACDLWIYPKDNLRALATAIGHIHALSRTASPHIMQIALSAFCLNEASIPQPVFVARPEEKAFISNTDRLREKLKDHLRREKQRQKEAAAKSAPPPPAVEEENPIIWWDILQVGKDASLTEVEASFRMLARRAHPDRGGNQIEMAKLNAAVAAARDSLRRKPDLRWG